MSFYIYLSMTTIGMLTKLWAFSIVRKHWEKKPLYYLVLSLVCVLLVQSLIEFYSYLPLVYDHPSSQSRTMTGYYICIILFITILPFIALYLTRRAISKQWTIAFVFYNFCIIFILLFTDLIIAGTTNIGFTYTANKGMLYPFFLAPIFLSLGFTVYTLQRKHSKSDGFISIRATNILLSCLPFVIFSILVIVAMQIGMKVNALGILPICFSLFIIGVVDNVCNKQIVDYSYWIPFSKKRREINKLIKPFIEIQSDGLDPELKKEYNKLITQHALELFDGNQTKAAEWLKVSQSWVSRNNIKSSK